MAMPTQDRRRAPRRRQLMQFRCSTGELVQSAATADVSSRGAFLRMKNLPPAGATIRLACLAGSPEKHPVQVVARVARVFPQATPSEARVGVGVEWLRAGCRVSRDPLIAFLKWIDADTSLVFEGKDKDGSSPVFLYDFPAARESVRVAPRPTTHVGPAPSTRPEASPGVQVGRSQTSYGLTGPQLVSSGVVTGPILTLGANGTVESRDPVPPDGPPEPFDDEDSRAGVHDVEPTLLFAARVVFQGDDIAGWATRVNDRSIDIVTSEPPPEVYERVEVVMRGPTGEKDDLLALDATVTSVIVGRLTEKGPQSTVALTLTARNTPDVLDDYRALVARTHEKHGIA